MKTPFESSGIAIGSMLVGLIVFGSLDAQGNPQGFGPADTVQASASSPVTPTSSNMVWQERMVQPTVDSQASMDAIAALQNSYALEGKVALQDLPATLSGAIGVPVWLDQRAIEFANLDVSAESTEFSGNEELLATSLHRYLNPLGLKVVVQNEGLVITADHLALARKGIGASQWVNLDEQAERSIASALKETVSADLVEETLQNAMELLGQQADLRIMIDANALEEIGLALDVPVSLKMNDVKLGTALEAVLSPLDLTYTVKREILHVTTRDVNETTPLIRLYWLDGTGFATQDVSQPISSIQTTIAVDSWDVNGGSSTISAVPSGTRTGLLVSTTYSVHQEIEAFFSRLREINFGNDPVIKRVQVPRVQNEMGGFGGGMGGGGMGGMGGGMGGGMF